MTLNTETETITCDTKNCERTANLSTSHAKGWHFDIETVENNVGKYADYCPDHANGKHREISQ